jgi:hypothetical protein
MAMWLVAVLGAGFDNAWAQTQTTATEEPKLGWVNSTDLSLVVKGGNSEALTLGFANKLKYVWKDARFESDVSGLRSDTSDDRFFLVDSGIEFPVGGAPSNPAKSLVKPSPTLDAENYLIRGGYEKNITPAFFWNTGISWDRNNDAGILNRYIAHAGVGNKWADSQRRRLATNYGVSYTDRELNEVDPEKDRRFGGARLGWEYTEHLNAGTAFDSSFATNVNLSDGHDYSISTTNAISVSVNSKVALKVSLQWLFENEPALETDLDVIAYVVLLDPDGIPGSGDERYQTQTSGSTKLVLGSANERKDKLDSIFRTALVIKF